MRSASALIISALSLCSVVLAGPIPTRQAAGKRGLVWTFYNVAPLDPAKAKGSGQVAHMYNYETFQPATGTGGLDFIGMQGCFPTCDSSPIGELATRAKDQGWTKVFSANEPDLKGLAPADVAAWYKQNIAPLTIQKALPAITSSTDAGKGLDWLQQFMDACAGACPHDWINLHHYGPDFGTFKAFVEKAHAQFPNDRIIVTEYALTAPATAEQQNAFFKEAIPFLDGADFVDMHFPFIATSPALFSANDANGSKFVGTGSTLFKDDGSLSAVGETVAA
ncbi:hypothetical protein DL96DRAFT_1554620 [Flagelloscypha sp. PMI_526]|nr:hypothetical protein DL96DRAFT_1554620 [Flagelloscypha sp. PMI_526]